MAKLDGQVAIVTDAARGLGLGYARRFAGLGGEAMGIEVDVCDHESFAKMVTQVAERWGRVDVLVANAGGGRGRPVAKASALDPALLQSGGGDEPVRHGLLV